MGEAPGWRRCGHHGRLREDGTSEGAGAVVAWRGHGDPPQGGGWHADDHRVMPGTALHGAPGSVTPGSTGRGAAVTATHRKEAVGMQTTIAWCRAAMGGAPSRRHAVWGAAVTATHRQEEGAMQTTIVGDDDGRVATDQGAAASVVGEDDGAKVARLGQQGGRRHAPQGAGGVGRGRGRVRRERGRGGAAQHGSGRGATG